MRHDIYLSISAQFKVDGISNYLMTKGVNLRLNGMSARRRCVNHAQITCSHERKLEGSRNWCGRHGKGVNIHLELSQFLLDTHTKFLFFVDDEQSKVFEFHRLSDEFMRTHHDINLSFCQVLKQSLRLGWGASAREVVHSHGKILQTLDKGLEKTKVNVFSKLARAVAGKSKVDDEVLDDLEEILVTSDVGVDTTIKIIRRIEERVSRDKYVSTSELNGILKSEITALLTENNTGDNGEWTLPEETHPYVILVVGVNGVGKTTTIGKLAWQFKQAGKKVYLGAADTFRAAAVEQIQIWGDRVGVPVIKQQMGADPASVAFDTLQSAKANGADVVIIDTAGRLHNKIGLMNELKKIKDVMKKVVPEAPHEVLLVLDGSTGQNAFEQARQFAAVTQITSLAITKLDGTAKGGVVIGISDQLKVPVKYIGLGEGMEDLQLFDKVQFVDSLFK